MSFLDPLLGKLLLSVCLLSWPHIMCPSSSLCESSSCQVTSRPMRPRVSPEKRPESMTKNLAKHEITPQKPVNILYASTIPPGEPNDWQRCPQWQRQFISCFCLTTCKQVSRRSQSHSDHSGLKSRGGEVSNCAKQA